MVVIFVHQENTKTNRAKVYAKIVHMEKCLFLQTKRVLRRVFHVKQVVSVPRQEFVLNVPPGNIKTKSVQTLVKIAPWENIKIRMARRTVKHVV
jgi:hypothetical protein